MADEVTKVEAFDVLMLHLAQLGTLPFPKLNVLLYTIMRLVPNQLFTFMVLLLWLVLAAYLSLYTIYPRSGTIELSYVPPFNDPISAFFGTMDVAAFGNQINIRSLQDFQAIAAAGGMSAVGLVNWLVLYYFYSVITCVLMINLLIALLTDGFAEGQAEATLMSRLSFSTNVCKLELLAESVGKITDIGEHIDGKPDNKTYHRFLAYTQRPIIDDEVLATTSNMDPFLPEEPSEIELLRKLTKHFGLEGTDEDGISKINKEVMEGATATREAEDGIVIEPIFSHRGSRRASKENMRAPSREI